MKFIINLLFIFILSSQLQAACTVYPVNENQFPISKAGSIIAGVDNHTILLLDIKSSNINVVDINQRAIIKTISVKGDVGSMAVNKAKKLLYVTDYFTNKISVFNLDGSAKFLNTYPIDAKNFGPIVYDANNQHLLVTTNNELLVLSPKMEILDRIASNKSKNANSMLIHNKRLYISYESTNNVDIYDLSQNLPKFSRQLQVANGPTAITNHNDSIYVANTNAASLSVIDGSTEAVTDTITHPNLLTAPAGLAYFNGHIWIADQAAGKLLRFDTKVNALLAETCAGLTRPSYLLATADAVYVSHANGLAAVQWENQLSAKVKKSEETKYTSRNEVLTAPNETFDLRIEGGSGRFDIIVSGGMKATKNSDREWKITTSPLTGWQTLIIKDLANEAESLTLIVRNGGIFTLSPSKKIDVELGGQSEVLTVSGGYPPYKWSVEHGLLSSTSAKQIVYTPRLLGEDIVTVNDASGKVKQIKINVSRSGIVISPSVAVMKAREQKTFYALGGDNANYQWQVPLGGNLSTNQGQKIAFTAPDNIGEYRLIVTDLTSQETAQTFIHVIDEEINLSPTTQIMRPNQSTSFKVSGGYGPYIWTSHLGDFSATEGDIVTYTAPQIISHDTIEVRDRGGRTATANVEIIGTMLITPATAFVSAGESVKFSIPRSAQGVKWQASAGKIEQLSDNKANYIAPQQSGRYSLIAINDVGQSVQAIIFVKSDQISISPNSAVLGLEQTILLKVTGGAAPYIWSTTMGSLSSTSGTNIFLTTPSQVADNNPFQVTVEDSTGKINTSEIKLTLEKDPLLGYDINKNGKLDITELYLAVENYLIGQHDDAQINELIEIYFVMK
jgi:YVTN family beta-propeller protein